MQILYTPKDVEDYLLETAEQCKTPTEIGSYSKDEKEFFLHEDFDSTLILSTELSVTSQIRVVEIKVGVEPHKSDESRELINELNRELSHIINRTFPGQIEVSKEGYTTENKHETVYQVSF